MKIPKQNDKNILDQSILFFRTFKLELAMSTFKDHQHNLDRALIPISIYLFE